MKKTYLFAALCLLTMASCTKNEFDESPTVASAETQIQLSTGVQTRAAIANGDNVTATIALISAATAPDAAAWNALVPRLTNTLTDGGLATYATDAANVSSGTFKANDAAGQEVSFSVPLYYDKKTADNQAYMVGVAPAGTVGNGNGKVTFSTIDGLQDVLYAKMINKGKVAEAGTNSEFFTFNHQTGQVRFKIKKEAGMSNVADSVVTVQSVTLLNVNLPESITLGDSAVAYQAKSEFTLPGVVTSSPADEAGIDLGSPVMVQPMATLNINITIMIGAKSKTYSNVPVEFTGSNGGAGITKGHSSLVTIEVKRKTTTTESMIEVKAVVAPWKTGNTGKVDLN